MTTLRKSRRRAFERKRPARAPWILGYAAMLLLAAFLIGLAPAQATTTTTDTVREVRFGDHVTYERAVIDLGSRQELGDIASTYSSFYREGDWVVRINLPTARRTLTTGGAGLGRAISRYHVVRTKGGSLSVYFHLTEAAKSVTVFGLDHPARVVIDTRPGGQAIYPRPVVGTKFVVLQPRAGLMAGPEKFAVRGYGRPFEAQGAWRVKNENGTVVRQGTYTTKDWATTWGAFAFVATYPAGLTQTRGFLEVGQYSPADGDFKGVSVPLRFR